MRVIRGAVGTGLATAALCCVLAGSPSAWAEGTSATDVVILKGGGMVRGTIAEKMPDDYVVIVTITGDEKRFDMTEVEYAGPADEAPEAEPEKEQAAQPMPPAPSIDTKVPVKFESSGEQVEFHLRVGSAKANVRVPGSLATADIDIDSFESLCEAPCVEEMKPGRYTFGLSEGDDQAVRADGAVRIDGPTTVEGEYHSYAGLRAAGWIAMFGGPAIGLVMVLSARNDCDPLDSDCEMFDPALMYGGMGVMVVGVLAGWAMVSKDDEAEVRLVGGMTRPRALVEKGETSKSRTAGLAPTLGLTGRF